jgi:hypothetical protein
MKKHIIGMFLQKVSAGGQHRFQTVRMDNVKVCTKIAPGQGVPHHMAGYLSGIVSRL